MKELLGPAHRTGGPGPRQDDRSRAAPRRAVRAMKALLALRAAAGYEI
jgi:hypothetical protein